MTEPTIAEERIARSIAFWHGQKVRYYKDGRAITVANMAGFDSGWAHEVDRYVEANWRDYIPAARAVLEMRS